MKLLSVVCLSLGLLAAHAWDWDVETPLDRYVNSDDGYFSWYVQDTIRYDNERVTVYIINMTSQIWQADLTDRPVWWHNMGIAVPDSFTRKNASFIWVGEQKNRDPPTMETNTSVYNIGISMLANETGCLGAYVLQIPNQPLKFKNYPDPDKGISEDSLIAWTWRTYIDMPAPPDETLPARMPMTKAAKRGVDTVQEFAQQYLGVQVDNFMPLGASKRGWTVWSLAATDRRVKFALPIVCNLLNMPDVITRQFESFDGGWSFAFNPYFEANLTADLYNQRTQEIFDIEDMYRYRERLTMPKLMIVATGDEFFLLDNTYVWWNDVPGPMYMYMVENTEHILFPWYSKVFNTITGAWLTYLDGETLPTVTWQLQSTANGASLTMQTDPPPDEITGFKAITLKNDTRRDFRLISGYPEQELHPVRWHNTSLDNLGGGQYYMQEDDFEGEWTGFFMRGLWYGPNDRRIYLTTEVQITPNTYPAPLCTQDPDCYGYLV